jgi:crossover junction endodeoxyribonuclease RuvC
MKIMGCDPSTYTGLCLLDGDVATPKLLNFPKEKGFRRLQLIAQSFHNTVTEWSPDIVVIEGYAYGNTHSLVTLVEVGTLLRKTLYDLKISWYDAPPTLLKKFTTGKGNSNKKAIAEVVLSRWGFSSKSDDVVDAYALARLGQALVSGDVTLVNGVSYHGVE